MIKRYYDPIVNDNAGGAGNPIVPEPVKFSADNPPKSKEDWQKLAQDDPKTWMDLTQQNTDRMFRENRELQEKLAREQQEKQNLSLEINRYKGAQPIVQNVEQSANQPYSLNNFPKTEQEWDSLAIERPTFAADLRFAYLNRQNSNQTNFQSARTNYAKEVQVEHPDMYLTELDTTGQPAKDDKGNVIFKRDQNGLVIFNPNSEKGKLWEQIYKESYSPDGTNPLDNLPNAPALLRSELERRLIKKGQNVIAAQNPQKQNQVAVPGVTPPVSAKVSFGSKEEEFHVEKAIERGTWKTKEEYCQSRDNGTSGFYEQSRRPDFSKK